MRVTPCTPDELLKLMRVFSLLEMQQSYNARKSAVEDVLTGGEGFRQVPLRTTSAHEGEPTPSPLPVGGGGGAAWGQTGSGR